MPKKRDGQRLGRDFFSTLGELFSASFAPFAVSWGYRLAVARISSSCFITFAQLPCQSDVPKLSWS